jgi:hypothetical protein
MEKSGKSMVHEMESGNLPETHDLWVNVPSKSMVNGKPMVDGKPAGFC